MRRVLKPEKVEGFTLFRPPWAKMDFPREVNICNL